MYTRWGVKRRICTNKNSKLLRFWDKMEGLPEITNSAGTENLNNQYTVLSVISGVLHFVGDSMVPDTIDKNFPEGAKVLQQVDKKFIPIVVSTAPDITDQVIIGHFWFLMNFLIIHLL